MYKLLIRCSKIAQIYINFLSETGPGHCLRLCRSINFKVLSFMRIWSELPMLPRRNSGQPPFQMSICPSGFIFV